MPIFIYNSLTRKKEEFIPLQPKEVKMYVCGPTVYDQPHIGHARSAYIFDVIRRYLTYRGYEVKFVRNVTDVDDKIIDKAQKEYPGEDLNSAVGKVATKYLDLYHEDMKSLGVGEPDVEPKATEYVCSDKPLMQKFIQDLIDKDCAYVSGGDVYFDIKKAKGYGKLSNQAIEKMESGARIALGEKKKDLLDFALWKSAKPGEPAWESPWGPGRPGWHIECSVMSSDILGDEFDIHGGGIDLIFPHHENEIAQSEGAGKKFAHYWIHHGLLTINAQKMSKSLGNFITVKDFLGKYKNADLLKLLFLSTHYQHPVDYTDAKIKEAHQALQRFEGLIDRVIHIKMTSNQVSTFDFIEKNENNFFAAMDNDFNTPQALGCLFDLISDTNRFIETQKDNQDYNAIIDCAISTVCKLARDIFGLSLLRSRDGFSKDESDQMASYLDAKKEKNYKFADGVREELRKCGIAVENTKDGLTRFRRL